MKYTYTLLLIILSFNILAQKPDTTITTKNYKSFINYKLQEPLYVKYILYKGGGACDRESFNFKNDTKIDIVGAENYTKSGYDKGHLANAEDFAYNCELDELTFRYYNCLPQTHNLNAGIWKLWETKIRNLSHSDSLLIICGGIWQDTTKVNDMRIPNKCWKITYSIKSKKIIYCQLYTNLYKESSVSDITLKELQKLLGYKIKLKY